MKSKISLENARYAISLETTKGNTCINCCILYEATSGLKLLFGNARNNSSVKVPKRMLLCFNDNFPVSLTIWYAAYIKCVHRNDNERLRAHCCYTVTVNYCRCRIDKRRACKIDFQRVYIIGKVKKTNGEKNGRKNQINHNFKCSMRRLIVHGEKLDYIKLG